MAEEIRLADEIEGFSDGVVIEWFRNVGEEIAVGDSVLEIEADKANMLHEAETAGVLIGIVVGEGEAVAPGDLLGWIGEPGEQLPGNTEAPAADEAPATAAEPVAETPPAAPVAQAAATPEPRTVPAMSSLVIPPPQTADDRRIRSSPLARRAAASLGIEIDGVTGTGPGGRIVKADIEAAAATPAPAARPAVNGRAAPEKVGLSRLQSTVARRMVESKTTVPHFYLRAQVDMTASVEARSLLKADAGGGRVPSFNDFIVKAVAITLADHPKVNGAYDGDGWIFNPQVNVGIAVATDDGLVVPVIRGTDQLTLGAISSESRRLAKAAMENRLTAGEYEGGTFTVSNLGMYGVSGFDAVVNPPQAAILSVGAIQETMIVKNGVAAPGSVLELGLSCDHRIVYGADGAAFLRDLGTVLENPVRLAL